MSLTVLSDPKRSLFILVPPKGPLSMLIRAGGPVRFARLYALCESPL